MTAHSSRSLPARVGVILERLSDRIGVLSLLALGLSTAGATFLAGL